MRSAIVALSVAASLALAACGAAAPQPSLSPGPSPATDVVQIFFARADLPPLAARVGIAGGLAIEARIRARFDALATAPAVGPEASLNAVLDAAPLRGIAVDRDLATLDFATRSGDWGVTDARGARAFVQQVVYTATDERSVHRVRLTQDGGGVATIAAGQLIVTYAEPLTRELVSPDDRMDRGVAYYARDLGAPLAVFLENAGVGSTAEARIRSRLDALVTAPASLEGGAFNLVPRAKARLDTVRIAGDIVTIDYLVPDGDWGIHGSAALRAFVQQLVFTASEEPGVARVLITQNGGETAIIGGEGLVIDRPATRAAVSGIQRLAPELALLGRLGFLAVTARVQEQARREGPGDHGEGHQDQETQYRQGEPPAVQIHGGIVRPVPRGR